MEKPTRLTTPELLDHIDHAINDPPLTIEESLDIALEAGRISKEEHDACLDVYQRAFLRSQQLGNE